MTNIPAHCFSGVPYYSFGFYTVQNDVPRFYPALLRHRAFSGICESAHPNGVRLELKYGSSRVIYSRCADGRSRRPPALGLDQHIAFFGSVNRADQWGPIDPRSVRVLMRERNWRTGEGDPDWDTELSAKQATINKNVISRKESRNSQNTGQRTIG